MYKNNWGYFTVPLTVLAILIGLYLGGTSLWQMHSQDKADKAALAAYEQKKALHIDELRSMTATDVVLTDPDSIDRLWVSSGAASAGYSIQEYEAATVASATEPGHVSAPWLK